MPGVGGARLTTAGRIRDESSVHALKIKEVDTRIESEIAGVRTSIQSAKFNVLQVRPPRQRTVPLTAVPCRCGYRCWCAAAGLPAYVPLRRGVARTSPAVCVARVDVFVQRVVKAEEQPDEWQAQPATRPMAVARVLSVPAALGSRPPQLCRLFPGCHAPSARHQRLLLSPPPAAARDRAEPAWLARRTAEKSCPACSPWLRRSRRTTSTTPVG